MQSYKRIAQTHVAMFSCITALSLGLLQIFSCDSPGEPCPECAQLNCGAGTIQQGELCIAAISEAEYAKTKDELAAQATEMEQAQTDLKKCQDEATACRQALSESSKLSSQEKGGRENAEQKLQQCEQDKTGISVELEKLRNGPQELLKSGLQHLEAGKRNEAISLFQRIVAEYPVSSEFELAKRKSAEIKKQIEKEEAEAKKAEEERLRKLRDGFKKVKIHRKKIKIGDIEVRSPEVQIGRKWRVDRYGYSWFEHTADKGSKYLSVDYTVHSESRDPDLPRIIAFIVENGRGKQIADLQTSFYKWSDYGAYLGNYHDPKNDFAKTSNIKFTSGTQISETYLKEHAVFVAVTQDLCKRRKYTQFENPPVSYVWSKCESIPYRFGPEYLEKLRIVHIHNKRALR